MYHSGIQYVCDMFGYVAPRYVVGLTCVSIVFLVRSVRLLISC
jgi:hypothetical protein